jgi:hypothetical protein
VVSAADWPELTLSWPELVKATGTVERCAMGKLSSESRKHPLYNFWRRMHRRCYNPKDKAYLDHGARGIKVCERWRSFENFAEDVDQRPLYASHHYTIGRIDNTKDYGPDNFIWKPYWNTCPGSFDRDRTSDFSTERLVAIAERRLVLARREAALIERDIGFGPSAVRAEYRAALAEHYAAVKRARHIRRQSREVTRMVIRASGRRAIPQRKPAPPPVDLDELIEPELCERQRAHQAEQAERRAARAAERAELRAAMLERRAAMAQIRDARLVLEGAIALGLFGGRRNWRSPMTVAKAIGAASRLEARTGRSTVDHPQRG